VRLETEEFIAAQRAEEAARTPNPKAMNAADRLAHANRVKLADMKAEQARDAKTKDPAHDFDKLKTMSPMERLALARNARELDASETKIAPKPTQAELKRMTPAQRLSSANAEALRAMKAANSRGNAKLTPSQRRDMQNELARAGGNDE
jgi:hypothetical protein